MTADEGDRRLAHVAVVVRDYDEAIDFYTHALGFHLVEDTKLGPDKRWVVVAPSVRDGASILLAKASNESQSSHVGNQTGGRVFLFLHTDDFVRDHREMTARGVRFVEKPRREKYGVVAVFEDLYGNRWDLIERKSGRNQESAS
jgi:catechol 2,3-dioxygenase-like lactoylglutathione lyase family enzyme